MNPIAPSHLKPPEPVPGGVYLCQVDENVSCGACCGLYNCPDASRAYLQERLAFRTERFREVPRDTDAIDAFREQMERRESRQRPYPDFYHCPFLGLVGRENSRVGCLLHPLAEGNQGVDLRGLSFYGGLACREYFCPSHRNLPPVYKTIIKSVAKTIIKSSARTGTSMGWRSPRSGCSPGFSVTSNGGWGVAWNRPTSPAARAPGRR